MLSKLALLLLPLTAWAVDFDDRATGSYNYNRCDAALGPAAWTGTCPASTQTQGTPINLCGAVTFTAAQKPTITSTGYTTARTMTITNSGTSVTISIKSDAPTVKAGNLSALVGRVSTNTSTHTWSLAQMHIHWGRTGMTSEGSEHYLQGTQYAGEAHFVHWNTRFSDITAAISSGSSDALMVVGVFLEAATSDESNTITQLANDISIAKPIDTAVDMSATVTLSDLWDSTAGGDYYSYGGGLTTPTCSEQVTWIVMKQTKTVKTSTMNKIWAASTNPGVGGAELISKYGNWRPLQSIGSRTVYTTLTSSASCSTPTEPTFVCSSASSILPSLGMQATFFLVAIFALRH